MTTKIFNNLQAELLKVAQEATGKKYDSRFKTWAKTVTSVNKSASNGYAFKGEWVNKGTVELELKPTVFLVAFTHGSKRYNVTEYAVITMDATGELHPTGIKTGSGSGGWALRIRDQVAALLKSLTEQEQEQELSPRDEFLATLQERFPEMSENEIVTAALNVYELHTRDR